MEWVCEWRANKQTLIWKFVLGTRMLGPNGGGMQHHSCLWQYTRGKMKFSLSKANPSVICLWLSPEVQWSFLCLWQSPDEVLFIYGYPQWYNNVFVYGLTPDVHWGVLPVRLDTRDSVRCFSSYEVFFFLIHQRHGEVRLWLDVERYSEVFLVNE